MEALAALLRFPTDLLRDATVRDARRWEKQIRRLQSVETGPDGRLDAFATLEFFRSLKLNIGGKATTPRAKAAPPATPVEGALSPTAPPDPATPTPALTRKKSRRAKRSRERRSAKEEAAKGKRTPPRSRNLRTVKSTSSMSSVFSLFKKKHRAEKPGPPPTAKEKARARRDRLESIKGILGSTS
mmetsp:Transcript_39695/g.124009  ORF Transcript_39695/g.124009 Transcript_39695/m.124009 type:complete len:185 (-) Transcript_39695:94-648(-)